MAKDKNEVRYDADGARRVLSTDFIFSISH